MAKCRGEVVYQNRGSRTADCVAFDDQALIHSYEQAVHSFMEALEKDRSTPECRTSSKSESDREEEEVEEEKEEGRQWQIGDACLAVWSGDGLLYPARITTMDQDRGYGVVCFDGYGNEEEQPLSVLLLPGWRSPEDKDAVMEWSVGDACQAVWSGDGLLYPATILELDAIAGTCCVEFDHYGTQERQALADLLPPGYREESSDTSPFPKSRSDEEKDQANANIPQSQKDKKPPPLHSHVDEEALIGMLLAWHLSGYYTGYYVGLREGWKKKDIPESKKGRPQRLRVSEHR